MINWEPGLTKLKDPDAVLNYKFKWDDWLDAGDTIQSAVVTAETGITNVGDSVVDAATAVAVQISGGVDGVTYTLACKITATPSGQIDERTINIAVGEL